MFGYLSPSVLCLFFLDGHRIHVVGSNKQGLVSEFRADLCQEFLRARNLLEKGKLGWGWGVPPQSPHMEVQGLEVSRLGSLGSGLRPESEGWWSQCPQPEHAPAHFTPTPRSPLQCSPDCSPVRLQGLWVGMAGCPFSPHSWQEWMTFPWGQWEPKWLQNQLTSPNPNPPPFPGALENCVSSLSEIKRKRAGREK